MFCAVRPSLGTMTSATEYLGGLDWTPHPLPRSSDRCVQELLGPTVLRTSCSGPLVWQGAGRLFNMKQTLVPLFGVNLRCQQPPPKYGANTLTTFCRILAAFAPVKSRTISTMPSVVVTGVFLFGSIRPLASGKLTGSQFVSRSPSELLVRYLGGPPQANLALVDCWWANCPPANSRDPRGLIDPFQQPQRSGDGRRP